MKKAIVLLLMLALMLPMLCFSANAEEYTDPKDARNVPPEIQELADEVDADVVFHKIYTPSLVMVCSESDSMDEVLERMDSSDYIAATLSEYWCYEMVDAEAKLTKSFPYLNSIFEQMITQEAIRAIAPDIYIESVYFLSTGFIGNAEPGAIYYKTNLGEYVYYNIDNGVILNADRFLEYMVEWRTHIEFMVAKNGPSMGGYPRLDVDLSAYDWRSPDFDPDAPLPTEEKETVAYLVLGGSVIVLAGLVAFGVIRARKKKVKEALEVAIPENE